MSWSGLKRVITDSSRLLMSTIGSKWVVVDRSWWESGGVDESRWKWVGVGGGECDWVQVNENTV